MKSILNTIKILIFIAIFTYGPLVTGILYYFYMSLNFKAMRTGIVSIWFSGFFILFIISFIFGAIFIGIADFLKWINNKK